MILGFTIRPDLVMYKPSEGICWVSVVSVSLVIWGELFMFEVGSANSGGVRLHCGS